MPAIDSVLDKPAHGVKDALALIGQGAEGMERTGVAEFRENDMCLLDVKWPAERPSSVELGHPVSNSGNQGKVLAAYGVNHRSSRARRGGRHSGRCRCGSKKSGRSKCC